MLHDRMGQPGGCLAWTTMMGKKVDQSPRAICSHMSGMKKLSTDVVKFDHAPCPVRRMLRDLKKNIRRCIGRELTLSPIQGVGVQARRNVPPLSKGGNI